MNLSFCYGYLFCVACSVGCLRFVLRVDVVVWYVGCTDYKVVFVDCLNFVTGCFVGGLLAVVCLLVGFISVCGACGFTFSCLVDA